MSFYTACIACSLTILDLLSIICISLFLPSNSSNIVLLNECNLENSPKSKQATAYVVSSSESNSYIKVQITLKLFHSIFFIFSVQN